MNHHNNTDEGLLHLFKGMVLGVCVFIYKLWTGFIDHNGGYAEIFYSLLTLVLFGLVGTLVSILGNMFWKWLGRTIKKIFG